MATHAASALFIVDRIKATLVGLRMPRALEIVDVIVRQLERGEATALEAIDSLLAEELTLREMMKWTLRPARTASTPRATARCDLPVPGGPMKWTASVRSMNVSGSASKQRARLPRQFNARHVPESYR